MSRFAAALSLVLLALTLVPAARADGGDEVDAEVLRLLEDYAPTSRRRDPRSERPLRSSTLVPWIARRLSVPRSALARMPARGERGELRWSVEQRSHLAVTTTYVHRDTGGDCPSLARHVLQHDAAGRLTIFRRLTETCEGVDSMFEEERFAYDAQGRLREVVRAHLRRPIDVAELEDLELTVDLTLPDGSMPPPWDPPARCTFEHGSRATRVTCGNDLEPAWVVRSYPTR